MSTPKLPIVFVIQPPSRGALDMSALYDYGTVQYVYNLADNRPPIWRADYVEDVLRRLETQGYDPLVDYFAVVGSMVPVVMVATAIAGRWPHAKLLYFSSTSREYVERSAVQLAPVPYTR